MGYRDKDHVIQGINLVVLDVDDGITMDTAKLLLKPYKFLLHTTKRHTPEHHRFRIIMPISHVMRLDSKDYKEFMNNIYEWLPFSVDSQTSDPARKWLCSSKYYEYNEGKLLDALQFIPKTKKNEERKSKLSKLSSLDNLQKWFIGVTDSGNRNNQLIKYALMLVDSGRDEESIKKAVHSLNNELPNKLTNEELNSTILRTVAKRIEERS